MQELTLKFMHPDKKQEYKTVTLYEIDLSSD